MYQLHFPLFEMVLECCMALLILSRFTNRYFRH